jgi:hypothetical protein
MRDLIGLCGEIHVYRALDKDYGPEVIGPSNWVSENSRYWFPENDGNDNWGCDFAIHRDGKTHYIEVKATQGEDDSFELGSSEIELAVDMANRRKEEFGILHVMDALSERPRFRLLPNPYDKRYKGKYRFENAGLRIRYEVG